jgi:hypothetical protein
MASGGGATELYVMFPWLFIIPHINQTGRTCLAEQIKIAVTVIELGQSAIKMPILATTKNLLLGTLQKGPWIINNL